MWKLSSKAMTVVITCFIASFMCTFLALSLLSAMKEISEEMSTDFSYVMWMTEASFISSIMFAIVTIDWADKYGKRNVMIVGLIVVAICTAISAFTFSIVSLVITRIIAGFGVAMVLIALTSIIVDEVDEEYRTEALALNYSLSCVGAAVGPMIGYWLKDIIGWRGLLLALVPVFILMAFTIRNARNVVYDPGKKIDYPSHLLYIFGMGFAINAWFMDGKYFWTFWVGLALLAVFFAVQYKRERKILDLSIFRNRLFLLSAALGLIFYFVTYCIDDSIVNRLEFMDGEFVIFGMAFSFVAFGGFLRGLKPTLQLFLSPLFARMSRGKSPMMWTYYAFAVLLAVPVLDLILKLTPAYDHAELLVCTVLIIYVLLAVSSSIFSPQNKSIMMTCVDNDMRNEASAIVAIVDNIGRLLGVMIMVNVIYQFGGTTVESFAASAWVALIIVLVCSTIGFVAAYKRRTMKF